ncbi:xanthine dehydrogenase family protein molybdopterin-binding subunit [Kibdelosporangium philippinense]|uniref:Xanthine dehydrogenase family protein molybdopterin-binding subunit n=1 Tax=Kibdelosporangium philippinense TaxID=211113 RepID=A0ABS8ZTP4_9PSEU|nr:xanthine dehydrogenase family protein molybdopterin-binding subunit [Kibdelosporangium philippinense]MCE7010972.1 xanthine dehydrogenase family protein molybdopterin-binding subunit [Kibdelosporangium philippinense]
MTVGQPVERVDGHAKVTGGARYTADRTLPGMLYAYLTLGTIARGQITAVDTAAARAVPGVVEVFTHQNAPRLSGQGMPLQGTQIQANGEIVAISVAATLEQAQEAAELVRVTYAAQTPVAVIADALSEVYLPANQEVIVGDPTAGLAAADVTVKQSYSSPAHHHNPIEPHASVAQWDGDRLTVHETSQGVVGAQRSYATTFGIPQTNVRVLAPYLGGGFGAKSPVWPHSLLNAAIARQLGRPVKIVLARSHMYSIVSHRAEHQQEITLGAKRDGTLTALVHVSTQQLSRTSENMFNLSLSSRSLYACPNIQTRQLGVRLDLPTPRFMRSPQMTAHFGLETALDELSYELGMDPLELRRRNYTDVNPTTGQRFSSKFLLDAYKLGADAFGWSRRNPKPGSTRDGHEFVGWGMATEAHDHGGNNSSSSMVRMAPDGTVLSQMATQDIGTGTYTVFTQIVADALGVPLNQVRVELADSNFPPGSMSAGSGTIASTTGAVNAAALAVRTAVIQLAVSNPASPLHGLPADQIITQHGYLFSPDRSRRESYREVMTRHGAPVENTSTMTNTRGYTTGAVFVEVRVDPRYGRVRVTRGVAAYDTGRVMNRQTARSQVIGGFTWGIGNALMEHTVHDRHTARVVNPNLSTYLIPVNADVPDIQAIFVDKPDPVSTALGARGFGETPGTGVAAAIGNAIYHATGRRIRDLPITQDKLM